MAKPDSEYNRKRDFSITSEPAEEAPRGKSKKPAHALSFVIQKHDARRLHYDFRLEMEGTLKSWAIPKGPSLDPRDKRLAVHVEDHPLAYAGFEGSIPAGQYGGGDVIVWDRGLWKPEGDPVAGYKSGKLKFTLVGEKLGGDWTLVRTHLRGNSDKEQWLLIKEKDATARPAEEYDIVEEQPQSVISGTLIAAKAAAGKSTKRSESTASKVHAKKASRSTKPTSIKKMTPLPDMISPELATLVSEPPEGNWLYEIKFDGYRILARVQNGDVRLFTRNGHDWTDRMPVQAKAIKALDLEDSWLDGEVVVLNERGLPDFQLLQRAFDVGRSQNILFYLFDAPFLNGIDLRDEPVEKRRAALEKIVPSSSRSPLRYSAAFNVGHQDIVESACAMSLEGVIGKRVGSPYVSRRSPDWIKLKCRLRQEFVIIGYTEPQGSRSGFGALLLGVHKALGDNEVVYAGRVGTGFNETSLKQLHAQLKKRERSSAPLANPLRGTQARGVHWVEPELVCEVEFAEWTSDEVLRQAVFIALRSDKPAKDIIRERPRDPASVQAGATSEAGNSSTSDAPKKNTPAKISSASKKARGNSARGGNGHADNKIRGITITHPDRVIDPESGHTKKELAEYYSEVSDWILPHLINRPVSILRAPDGITGELFFQKHAEHMSIPHIKRLDQALDPSHPRLMEIPSPEALVGVVQMSTVELHTWGSAVDHIDQPDHFVLDLDPDPALPWRSLIEAARLTLAVLDELKLKSFIKTSGGKGVHLVVPVQPEADWIAIKAFSKAIAHFMAKQIPDRFVDKMGPKNRVGKIFIDYLRNQRGASTVCAFSVRARPGLPISVPITREELTQLTSAAQWNIGNIFQRLDSLKQHPWDAYENRQRITSSMWKRLGAKAP